MPVPWKTCYNKTKPTPAANTPAAAAILPTMPVAAVFELVVVADVADVALSLAAVSVLAAPVADGVVRLPVFD